MFFLLLLYYFPTNTQNNPLINQLDKKRIEWKNNSKREEGNLREREKRERIHKKKKKKYKVTHTTLSSLSLVLSRSSSKVYRHVKEKGNEIFQVQIFCNLKILIYFIRSSPFLYFFFQILHNFLGIVIIIIFYLIYYKFYWRKKIDDDDDDVIFLLVRGKGIKKPFPKNNKCYTSSLHTSVTSNKDLLMVNILPYNDKL